jgi:hypothetical protein
MDEQEPNKDGPESKQEALMRLLCHYLIYIGKATSLLEASSDEKSLVNTWRSQWNKPAAFTWNSSNGLEMHYRIQPPANWIVSSSEDESMSSIDFDLSELDDGDEFTANTDLLKCTACDTFWAILDTNGYCQNCQPPFDSSWLFQDADITSNLGVSFDSTVDLETDVSFELQGRDTWEEPFVWGSDQNANLDFSPGLGVLELESSLYPPLFGIDMHDLELDYLAHAVTSDNNRSDASVTAATPPHSMNHMCGHFPKNARCTDCGPAKPNMQHTDRRSRGKDIGPPSSRSPKRLLTR